MLLENKLLMNYLMIIDYLKDKYNPYLISLKLKLNTNKELKDIVERLNKTYKESFTYWLYE